MPQQETLSGRCTGLWDRQIDWWVDSVASGQYQLGRMLELWMNQAVEAQKEGQRFAKEWMDSLNKAQADFWRGWQDSVVQAAQAFGPLTRKETPKALSRRPSKQAQKTEGP